MWINTYALTLFLPLLVLTAPLDPSTSAIEPAIHGHAVQTGSGLEKRWLYCEHQQLGSGPICSRNGHSCEKELGPEWKGGAQGFTGCWFGTYTLDCLKCREVPDNCYIDDNGDEDKQVYRGLTGRRGVKRMIDRWT
ncbi:hypothetical protein GJ744_012316 [Endocarpon pusillum]|uniref:Uncharacterized protein n=1 Tax=Endocarpon pusillum TaxID=364733 RepID=A0A8H7ADH7_9EURO|nr:hypothetical protein GJ744_012316 [Endocarpon pusillum]